MTALILSPAIRRLGVVDPTKTRRVLSEVRVVLQKVLCHSPGGGCVLECAEGKGRSGGRVEGLPEIAEWCRSDAELFLAPGVT